MDKQKELDAFHARCFSVRVPVYKICEEAGVAQSTVSRWNKDPSTMTASTLRRLEVVLERMEKAT